MSDTFAGKVTHYYDKLGVAIVEITNSQIHTGDTIKFSTSEGEFTQKIDSMQIEHEKIEKAKKGMTIGIKVDKETKKGAQVFIIG